MIDIDIHANQVPGDDQLNDQAFRAIRALYSQGREMKILRMMLLDPADPVAAANFTQYNTDIEAISAQLATAKTAAANLRAALAYEAAMHTLGWVEEVTARMKAMGHPLVGLPMGISQANIDAANLTIQNVSADVLAIVKQRGKV